MKATTGWSVRLRLSLALLILGLVIFVVVKGEIDLNRQYQINLRVLSRIIRQINDGEESRSSEEERVQQPMGSDAVVLDGVKGGYDNYRKNSQFWLDLVHGGGKGTRSPFEKIVEPDLAEASYAPEVEQFMTASQLKYKPYQDKLVGMLRRDPLAWLGLSRYRRMWALVLTSAEQH